jgi:hypothetical protein
MKFILLSLFSLVGAYTGETVTTVCFFVNSACHKEHAADVLTAINKKPGYISHSTTSTKLGMHSIIVYDGFN